MTRSHPLYHECMMEIAAAALDTLDLGNGPRIADEPAWREWWRIWNWHAMRIV